MTPSVIRNAMKPGGIGLHSPSTTTVQSSPSTSSESSRKRASDRSERSPQSPKKLPRRDRLPGEEDEPRTKKKEMKVDEPKRTPSKKESDAEEEVDTGPQKDFTDLMEHVVFVLSGFENPLRSELRDKAREMGASYSWNWTDDCTHLM